jgi:aryl-alcohol dehydrogenase-like predicted oxidoreductase
MKSRQRHSLIVATKVTGPGHGWFRPPVRDGFTALDRRQIVRAAEDSLRRLQTDYIDLFQTHWPDHGMPYEEVLEALDELVTAGKVRVVGCSNETTWGLTKGLWAAEKAGTARFETVQNNFSLINRRCQSELAQACRQESVSLLPYSPLAGGVLTGKYLGDAAPEGARFTDYLAHGNDRQKEMAYRFANPRSLEVVARVKAIAEEIGMSVTTLATAWSKQHDFVASTIIGASHIDQLDETLAAADVVLDEEILGRLDAIETEIPLSFAEDGLRWL